MRGISVIVVFDRTGEKILLCKRTKEPYRGLYDFVGGKCERDEDALNCAYRELREETGIDREAIRLEHIMDFAYHTTGWCVQVFSGQLLRTVTLVEEINPLSWVSVHEDFFDTAQYAGEGYIGHVLSHLRMQLFAPGGFSNA